MNQRSLRLALPIALAAAAVAAGLTTAAVAATDASHPVLIGTVGKNNAYKISLTTADGKIAKSVKAGTYTVVIHDDSKLHNYELDGPHGKSWTFTSVGFTGTKTITLKLVPGAYKAYCAPHEPIMFQHFKVTE